VGSGPLTRIRGGQSERNLFRGAEGEDLALGKNGEPIRMGWKDTCKRKEKCDEQYYRRGLKKAWDEGLTVGGTGTRTEGCTFPASVGGRIHPAEDQQGGHSGCLGTSGRWGRGEKVRLFITTEEIGQNKESNKPSQQGPNLIKLNLRQKSHLMTSAEKENLEEGRKNPG